MNQNKALWSCYEKDIELYKFYFEIALKFAVFVFGLTGAIISYYFTNSGEEMIHHSLLFPAILNTFASVVSFISTGSAKKMKTNFDEISKKLEMEFILNFNPLVYVLRSFYISYGITGLAVFILYATKAF